MEMTSVATWQDQLARGFVEAGVDVAAWVPDKRLDPIARSLVEENLLVRTLTREEECVGYAAGVRAVGDMPLVLFQCSGLGNAQNALGSLAIPYGLGFPIVISMRGTLGERNPSQVTLGRITRETLALLGIQSFSLRREDEVAPLVQGSMALARDARQVTAIILEPELELR
jgi:sulfopyruvate decarboxylase subunit alpha